jgi:hypothetical protein
VSDDEYFRRLHELKMLELQIKEYEEKNQAYVATLEAEAAAIEEQQRARAAADATARADAESRARDPIRQVVEHHAFINEGVRVNLPPSSLLRADLKAPRPPAEAPAEPKENPYKAAIGDVVAKILKG